jgi:hypothetical protein
LSNLKSDVDYRGKIRLSFGEMLVVGGEGEGYKKDCGYGEGSRAQIGD